MKHDNYRIWSWILAVVLLGTLWHFAYAISGDAYFVGLIAPVNESVWEHLKIVYLPILAVRNNCRNILFGLWEVLAICPGQILLYSLFPF